MDGTFLQTLKELIEDHSTPNVVEVGDKKYVKGYYNEVREDVKDEFAAIQPISFSDLKSFAEITNKEKDQLVPNGNYWVKIESHDTVKLISDLTEEKKRRNIPYEAKALVPTHNFGRNMDYEQFVIWLRSTFVPNKDCEDLVKLIAGIVHSETVEMNDDGMSQSIKAFKGTKSNGGEVKSIVKLAPYRIFAECVQPESEFLFRIQGNGTMFSLHEADGGKWKLAAKQNIKAYLETVIKKDNGVSILL